MRRINTQENEHFSMTAYLLFALITAGTLVLCVGAGSVRIAPSDVLRIIGEALFRGSGTGASISQSPAARILLSVRLPRVLCVALSGASLALCGAVMQGLLKNPLADGSTLGVSSGASLGAVVSIAFGITVPSLPFAGTMSMAILFAFLSLLLILFLAYRMDHTLSTNTIILIGVIYSMFVSSIMTLIIVFASDRLRSITFWTMGSLSGSSYGNAAALGIALLVCGIIVLRRANELNAFAVDEENARHIGVNVRSVRLTLLITVSVLIGICVSIGGTIAFVGLVTPHIMRMLCGPNHKRLLPSVLFGGAVFLMLADLAARVLLRPLELPLGAVTSLAGAVVFLVVFHRSRHPRRARGQHPAVPERSVNKSVPAADPAVKLPDDEALRPDSPAHAAGVAVSRGESPMLEAVNISVSYDDGKVLSDLSFDLYEGDWLMLIGPNGAGKTTALEALTGGVRYDGSVRLSGRDIRGYRPAELARSIGMLAQESYMQYPFTVREIVSLGRYAYRGVTGIPGHASSRGGGIINAHSDRGGVSPEDVIPRDRDPVDGALELTGLMPLADRSILTLSGGEQQRVFLAQLFAQDPEILMLDEPTSHLDPAYQEQIMRLTKEWLSHGGRAVISVVHDLALAKKYGSRAILLNHGKTVAGGSAADVFTRENLGTAYGMDVYEWMKDLLSAWDGQ